MAGKKKPSKTKSSVKKKDLISTLKDNLKSKDPRIRENAVAALGKRKEKEAKELALQALNDQDVFVRCAAAHSLSSLNALPPNIFQLMKKEKHPLAAYCMALSMGASSGLMMQLIKNGLEDADPNIRSISALGLSAGSDARAVNALKVALVNDADAQVRLSAAYALGEIKHPAAVDALVEALSGDIDEDVKLISIWALGKLKDEKSVGPLMKLISGDNPALRIASFVSLRKIRG